MIVRVTGRTIAGGLRFRSDIPLSFTDIRYRPPEIGRYIEKYGVEFFGGIGKKYPAVGKFGRRAIRAFILRLTLCLKIRLK